MSRKQKGKIKKSWVAMAAAVAMMVGSCMSVCAAETDGPFDGSLQVIQEQVNGSGLVDDEVIEHTGTADELFAGLTIEEDPGARAIKSIDWTIKSMVVKKTAYFSKKSGDVINVAGVVDPKNITVQVGIVEPDDHLRYIDAKGSFSHTFNLTKNGFYKVYIENLTKTKVHVDGVYS